MKLRRILAGVLSAAMVLTCAPVSALAEGGEAVEVVESTVDETGGAEETTSPGVSLTDNEVIFTPDENGNFADINSTDNPEVMRFLNSLSSIVVTVTYKYTDQTQANKTVNYPLFSMEGADGKHFTVRMCPKRGDGNHYTDFNYAYTNSSSGLRGGVGTIPRDVKWHKLSFSMTSKPYSSTDSNPHNIILVDGKTIQNWNCTSSNGNFYPTNHLTGSNDYTAAHIGKVPSVTTRLTNIGSEGGWEDFPGEIKYVSVSSANANLNDLQTSHTDTNSVSLNAWTGAKNKYTELTEGKSYTAESWEAFIEKLHAEPATECDMLNELDDLNTAYAALEVSTEDTKAATLAALQERITALTPFKEAGENMCRSGYEEFVAKLDEVSEMASNAGNYIEPQLQEAIDELNAAFNALVFIDKVYTDAEVGGDLYDVQDAPFYSYMNNLAFTMVFKYDTTSHGTKAPLITFRNDNGQWVTIYYCANGTNGVVGFSYPNSWATSFTAYNDEGGTVHSGITNIGDLNYHKLTFAFEDGKVHIKLDNKNVACIKDTSQTAHTDVPWFHTLVKVLSENQWTHVEIGKKSSNDTNSNFSGSGYLSNFPAATIKYVQISRNACDGEGITAVNASVNDEIKKERDALVKEKEDLVSNGVSTYYTDNTWSAYDTACTAAAAAATDWDMLNKIAPLKTAKDSLSKISQQFEGCSVALEGKIDMNFHTNVAANDDTKTPKFTSGGKTLKPEETVVDNKKVYTVKLPAKEMTDEIIVDMCDENGAVLDRVAYSIADYANKLLADDAQSDDLKALVKSMLNYGAAAQAQFGHNIDDLANKGLSETDKSVTEIGNKLDASCGNQRVTAESYKGFSLVLDSETALKLYFEGEPAINVKKNGVPVVLTTGKSNGLTYVKVPNIKANNLGDDYTVCIGEQEIGTVSALTYCYQVAKGNYDAKLKKLVNALYDYNQKAITFSQQPQS